MTPEGHRSERAIVLKDIRLLFAYDRGVPLCSVSFTDTDLLSHSIDVEAHSLFEAGALALAEFRNSGIVGVIGPAIRFQIEVRRPPTRHEISVAKVEAWLASTSKCPSEQAVKGRIREAMK